eukprot:COSAG01_NODE_45144_length_412_cov_0.782748_1_plen_89_part_01
MRQAHLNQLADLGVDLRLLGSLLVRHLDLAWVQEQRQRQSWLYRAGLLRTRSSRLLLDQRNDSFSHGQTYVAFGRACNRDSVCVLIRPD